MPDVVIRRGKRPAPGFQQEAPDDVVAAVCEEALGPGVVRSATATTTGTYNVTFRLGLAGGGEAYLRFAPEPAAQGVADRHAMRNEHAASPFVAVLGAVAARTLAVDFTHRLVDRDWVVHAAVPGVPASDVLPGLDDDDRAAFHRNLGAVCRTLHGVQAEGFGRALAPVHSRWSRAVAADVAALAEDARRAGVDAGLVARTVAAVAQHADALDAVRVPVLLHGDLWTPNVLLAPGTPRITGVLDHDAARWGDPRAEWTLYRVRLAGPATEAAFRTGYGALPDDDAAAVRDAVYALRHTLAVRLDIDRRSLDRSQIPPVHWDLEPRLAALGA